jgi:hypothetical protein
MLKNEASHGSLIAGWRAEILQVHSIQDDTGALTIYSK